MDTGFFGFPNSIITKLRYCTQFTLTSAAAARGINVFAANGIFDPDITGIGHQPMYRDVYAGIYNNYVVIGSKITAHYLSKTVLLGTQVGITGDDDSTISTVTETLREQNNSISTYAPAPGGPVTTLTATFEPLLAFGVEAKDDGTSATAVGSNPAQVWMFGVWAAAADGASATNCDIIVEIEYTVKFTELVSPTQN